MTEDNKSEQQAGGQSSTSTAAEGATESGDPGRTPGSAEGDRETVEADLRDKEGDEEK